MMLNFPHYSRFQWHPYSVCSGRDDSTINFMIKNNGDFSGFLVKFFQEAWDAHGDVSLDLIQSKKKKHAAVEPERKFSFD